MASRSPAGRSLRRRSALVAVVLALGAAALESSGPREGDVVDGHHLGPERTGVEHRAEAVDAVRAVADGEIRWFEEVFIGPDGSQIILRGGGLARPVGLAVVRSPLGVLQAFSVSCGPLGCEISPGSAAVLGAVGTSPPGMGPRQHATPGA